MRLECTVGIPHLALQVSVHASSVPLGGNAMGGSLFLIPLVHVQMHTLIILFLFRLVASPACGS